MISDVLQTGIVLIACVLVSHLMTYLIPIFLRPWSIRPQPLRDRMPLPVRSPTVTPSPILSLHSYLEENQEEYFQYVGYPKNMPPSHFPSPNASVNKLTPRPNEQVRRTDIRLRRSAQQFVVRVQFSSPTRKRKRPSSELSDDEFNKENIPPSRSQKNQLAPTPHYMGVVRRRF